MTAAIALVCLGSLALLPVWSAAWRLWVNDPLRSIGALFPILALLGLLRAWRELGFATRGTWTGLALAAAAIAAASLFSATNLLLFLFGGRVRLLHPGMALFAYAAGATLLFGGPRLLRRAFAPLCLLLLLDPVPHLFNKLLDLPLQTLSAATARAFAHLIGLHPSGEQLRMMFAPDFGMFIVPGCNGIRGAVTFGYLALIFGYLRRLPPRTLAGFTAAAILLGYLFNLIRLCTLVLYYRAGLAFPAIRPFGTQVDYVLGVSLFLLAALGTGFVISVYQFHHRLAQPPLPPTHPAPPSPVLRRALALAAVALAFFIPQARSATSAFHPPLSADTALAAFPHQVGPWTLTRTWQERDATGQLMFLFGDYSRLNNSSNRAPNTSPDDLETLSLGVYLASEDHYVFVSKLAQGIRPDTQGSLAALSPEGRHIHLFTSFYRAGDTLTLDAETSCRQALCDANLAGNGGKVGFLSPHLADLLVTPAARRIPLLLRRTQALATPPRPQAQSQIEADFRIAVQQFMAALDVQPLLHAAE